MPQDPKYAIVPRFADWEFPHGNLPQYWKHCVIPRDADAPRSGASIVGRDVSCRITAHREGTQTAHLVPTSEAVWFNHNTMNKYAVDVETVNDGRNLILLRSDLHSIFDARNSPLFLNSHTPKRSPPLWFTPWSAMYALR